MAKIRPQRSVPVESDTTVSMEFHVQYSLCDTEHQSHWPSSCQEFHQSPSAGSQLHNSTIFNRTSWQQANFKKQYCR